MSDEQKLEAELDSTEVPKGLATWMGLILVAGQYAGAIALFAASAHDQVAIAALATATATAVSTILGRMYQAGQAAKPANITIHNPAVGRELLPLSSNIGSFEVAEYRESTTAARPATDDVPKQIVDPVEEAIMSKDSTADADEPGDDEDLELDVDDGEDLHHAPDSPEGGPPETDVAPVPAHTNLKDD